MDMDADKAIETYVKTRDKVDKIKKEQVDQLRPYYDLLEKLEGWLQGKMTELNLTSLKGASGTAFTKTTTSAKVADWENTLAAIVRDGRYELLEQRVSKKAVEEYVEAFGEPPPGVLITRETVVQVRRG